MNQDNGRSLIDYGIQTERSQVRVHVCPVVQRVYVYPTECGVKAINSGRHRKVPGYQDGVATPTAEGYLVPPEDIERCVGLSFRSSVWEKLSFSDQDDLSTKGEKAVHLVMGMLRAGLFPMGALAEEIDDRMIQIDGTDIIIQAAGMARRDLVIQVKCDFPGGPRELGGTGNLFLQVAECNPFHKY